jgi:4-hydroxy-tetrahydrodipicolinate synthase
MFEQLSGVYAAVVTPLTSNYQPDNQAIPSLLEFLANRSCQGALVLGTTGEGPSFSPVERVGIIKSAIKIRQEFPDFHLLAGTGTPSLTETIELTKTAFDLGADGVVVLPPYYFQNVTEQGLFNWLNNVISLSVPEGKAFFWYHIPAITGVPLSIELLTRLKETFPTRFAGIKDSSSDVDLATSLGDTFQNELTILSGNDRLFSHALDHHACGCITALANICSPDLSRVWQSFCSGQKAPQAQVRLDTARSIMEKYAPFPSFVKAMLAYRYHFPMWPVRPPLDSLSPLAIDRALVEMDQFCEP